MQPTPNSQELAQIMRFVQSPRGSSCLRRFSSLTQMKSTAPWQTRPPGITTERRRPSPRFSRPREAKKLLSQVEGGK